MAKGASPSLSGARRLVGVLALVIGSFVTASAVAQHYESAIAVRANDIVANAMPSVQLLSTARGELMQLEVGLERYATAAPAARGELEDNLRDVRHEIDAKIASYLALPFFPDEPELAAPMRDDLAAVDRALPAFLANPAPTALDQLRQRIARTDQALQRMVNFDADQGERLGLEIESIRGNTRGRVTTLDGIALMLAAIAGVLAVRQLRRSERAQIAEREALARRQAELAAQNEVLGQFSGRVAHDILSPLSTTLMSLELARQNDSDAKSKRVLDRGVAAINRVQVLVDGLLAFARAGGKPEPGVRTPIAPVVHDVVDELRAQAADQRIALTAEAVPSGDVACSAGVLTSLLTNLIQNAIKYMNDSPQRRITVRCRMLDKRVHVEVEDTGRGIPEDQQARIFEPYVQLDHSRGIGLGLATVSRLARAHGGDVGVRSAVGHGSVFWFELPT